MKNVEVRAAYMTHGIRQWELAGELGLSETHFSRKLRYELPPEELPPLGRWPPGNSKGPKRR